MNTAALWLMLLLALATASISFTLTNASIFEGMRKWIAGKSKFFGKLISCWYCTSHYVAAGMVLIFQPNPFMWYEGIGWFILMWFALVGASAVIIRAFE